MTDIVFHVGILVTLIMVLSEIPPDAPWSRTSVRITILALISMIISDAMMLVRR